MGCGMLLCILTGGNVDLSVGATLCLVGAIAAQLMSNTSLNAVLVIIICLAISAVIGTWQGFWIGYMHIPPFICTLAGMFLFRGLGRVVLESKTVSISNKLFLNIFSSYITVPGVGRRRDSLVRHDRGCGGRRGAAGAHHYRPGPRRHARATPWILLQVHFPR